VELYLHAIMALFLGTAAEHSKTEFLCTEELFPVEINNAALRIMFSSPARHCA
jgi:hypothetical protein